MPGASDEEEVLISSLSLSSSLSTSSSSSLSTSLSSSLQPSLSLPLSSFFCQHARNQHQHLRYQVLAYTVSQLSISPENTIFHFLHLDVGEVQKKLHRQKKESYFSSPSPKHIFPGCVSGSLGPTFRPLSHPSARQLQVPSISITILAFMIFSSTLHIDIPIPMISNHHQHESAGRPVRSSIAVSRWRYAAKNWFDKL